MANYFNSMSHAEPRVANDRRGLLPRSLFAPSSPTLGGTAGTNHGGAPPPLMPVPVRGGPEGGSDPLLTHPGPGPATLPSAVLPPPTISSEKPISGLSHRLTALGAAGASPSSEESDDDSHAPASPCGQGQGLQYSLGPLGMPPHNLYHSMHAACLQPLAGTGAAHLQQPRTI